MENHNSTWNVKPVCSPPSNDFQSEFIKTINSDVFRNDLLKNSGSFSTSRYGRARKPKIAEDYYCSDEAISPMLSPVSDKKTTMPPSNSKAKSKKIKEFSNIPPNGVKSRLTIDESNFSDMESDYNSLLKIVSRPSFSESISPTSPTFKYSSLKTYSNRKKRTSECSNPPFGDDILSKLDSFSWTQNLMDSSSVQCSTPEKSSKSNVKRKLLLNNSTENGKINSIAERILLEFSETENECTVVNTCENNVTSSDNYRSGFSRFNESDLYVEEKEENQKIEEVQSPVIDSSTQNNQEQLPVDPGEWKIGDLIWSRVGNYPYWPSMITREPGSNLFMQEKAVGRNHSRVELHVRFFADCGRRGWIPAHTALKFNGKKAFDEMAESVTSEARKKDRKYVAGFTLNPSSKKIYKKWLQGVEEAESLMLKTVSERLKYFAQIIAENNKKKLQASHEKSNKKSQNKNNKNLDKQSENVNSENSHVNEKIEDTNTKLTNEEDNAKKNVENVEISEETKDTLKDNNKTPVTSKEVNKKGKIFRDNFKNIYPVRERKTVERYNASFSEYTEKNNLQIDEIKKEEDENFDDLENKPLTDRVGNAETNTPSSTPSVTSQIISAKKQNLFKGTIKDKLCQICEKPTNVFKCRGTCMRFYHQKCASNPEKYRKLKTKAEDISLITDDESSIDSDNENDIPNTKTPQKFTQSKNSKNRIEPIKTVTLSLAEQIDAKMAELMKDCDKIKYTETSTEESGAESDNNSINEKIMFHVTGDSSPTIIEKIEEKIEEKKSLTEFKCKDCLENRIPACFICGSYENEVDGIKSDRQKCSFIQCGRVYHPKCLETWPQTQWTSAPISSRVNRKEPVLESLICPIHVCHTCVSDDPRGLKTRLSKDKLAKCVRCPTAYHASNYCVAAGSEVLSYNQIICPKHISRKNIRKSSHHVNASWCFICAIGGSLICCETCPNSFHAECLQINPPEGSYICEDCETGRLPLYNEVVWVKLGSYRWWPAQILFPYEIPDNILSRPHQIGEFAVKFFGSHDYYWINRGRVFLYQEGDSGSPSTKKSNVDELFMKALEEAAEVFKVIQMERKNREAEWVPSLKPPPYIKIKTNKPVGNVRVGESHTSSLTPCECSPDAEDPCGPDSDCLNRLLLTECNPEICPAGTRCRNQQFEKREYPQLVPYQTSGRGWGLKTLESIKKGQFVIEYVGEMINEEEYQRRIKRMNEQKHENYYFLTIDKDRMLDAGPKGNVARFMNHSCQPNCETQKWTVNGNTRVGLFALQDIPPDTELTFNYNLECIGKEKKICKCGTPLCSGFIGVKVKQDELNKKVKTIKNKTRIKYFSPKIRYKSKSTNLCFICGENGSDGKCRSKMCSKTYHMACVKLEAWPKENWWCPRHKCHFCSRQKNLKWCSKCIRSFCPLHVENKFIKGITEHVCTLHEEKNPPQRTSKKKEESVKLSASPKALSKNPAHIKLKNKQRKRVSLSLKQNSNKNGGISTRNSDSGQIIIISDSSSDENNQNECDNENDTVKQQNVPSNKKPDSKNIENYNQRPLTVRKLSLRSTVVQLATTDNNQIDTKIENFEENTEHIDEKVESKDDSTRVDSVVKSSTSNETSGAENVNNSTILKRKSGRLATTSNTNNEPKTENSKEISENVQEKVQNKNDPVCEDPVVKSSTSTVSNVITENKESDQKVQTPLIAKNSTGKVENLNTSTISKRKSVRLVTTSNNNSSKTENSEEKVQNKNDTTCDDPIVKFSTNNKTTENREPVQEISTSPVMKNSPEKTNNTDASDIENLISSTILKRKRGRQATTTHNNNGESKIEKFDEKVQNRSDSTCADPIVKSFTTTEKTTENKESIQEIAKTTVDKSVSCKTNTDTSDFENLITSTILKRKRGRQPTTQNNISGQKTENIEEKIQNKNDAKCVDAIVKSSTNNDTIEHKELVQKIATVLVDKNLPGKKITNTSATENLNTSALLKRKSGRLATTNNNNESKTENSVQKIDEKVQNKNDSTRTDPIVTENNESVQIVSKISVDKNTSHKTNVDPPSDFDNLITSTILKRKRGKSNNTSESKMDNIDENIQNKNDCENSNNETTENMQQEVSTSPAATLNASKILKRKRGRQTTLNNNNSESKTDSLEENNEKTEVQNKNDSACADVITENKEPVEEVQNSPDKTNTNTSATDNLNTQTSLKRKRGRPRKSEQPTLNNTASSISSTENITINVEPEIINDSTVFNGEICAEVEISTTPIEIKINDDDDDEVGVKKRKLSEDMAEITTTTTTSKVKKRKILVENENQPKRLLRNTFNKVANFDSSKICNETLIVVVEDDCNLPIRKRSGLRSLTFDRISTNSI